MRHTLTLFFCCVSASLARAQYVEPGSVELLDVSIGAPTLLFGWAVCGLGDINGDSVSDLAVAAPFASSGSLSSAGRIYALSGADGATLWSRNGTRTSSILGFSLETMDWNGDGTLDVVSGAPFANAGRTWIYSGVDGSTLVELLGEAANSGFGASVATGGDFDGDGTEDLIVAAPLRSVSGTESGRLYVYTRGSTTPFTTLDGPHAFAQYGIGLSYVGDTDADGRDEIVAGYRDALSFFDGFADVLRWDGAAWAVRHTVSGVGMGANLMGDRIDGGMDADGDGVPDFLVGDMDASEVEVFSGATGALHRTLDGNGEAGDFASAHFVADVDLDGRAEILVGAWQSNAGALDSGRAYVCSGASGAVLKTITPTGGGLNFGIDARACGDLDGDGRGDWVIGVYGDGFSGSVAGRASVFSGYLPAPANALRSATLPGDPSLADAGGDPATGPVIASQHEVFDAALDCTGALAAGPFAIHVRSTVFAAPVATTLGALWVGGTPLLVNAGLHTQNVVHAAPGGVVLPSSSALIGLSFGVQGFCGGRLSNALVQTIGG